MMKLLFSLTLLVAPIIAAAQTLPIELPDTSKFAQEILDVQPLYSQSGSLKTLVPEKMAAGQNGYLIATNEYIRQNSKELANFIKHKEARGFKVTVATEKDFGLSEPGKGRHQADTVRKWMVENYQDLNLLYTLIIENPHPEEGLIPMAKFKPRKYKVPPESAKKDYEKFLKYKDNPRTEDGKYLLFDGDDPSDYYYADLDSNWDANGNSILAEKDDYATGEINCVADVWVGRIPYYGEEHEYFALKDVDELLRRTIDYENDTGDLAWRNNLFYVGGADKRFKKMQDHILRYSGGLIESYRVSSGYGYEPTSSKWSGGKISTALNENTPFGFVNFQEHGSPTSMAGQINTKSALQLERDKPAYVYLGGCDVASPEHDDNITYALYRRIGVGALGATRSVTSIAGDDDTDSAAGYERLYFGQSTGEAHWRMLSDYADGMGKVGASNFLMNLIGDPSVVIMPRVEPSSVVVAPNMEVLKFNHQHQSRVPIGYNFHVRNTTDSPQTYTISSQDGLNIEPNQFRLPPAGTQKVGVRFADAAQLSVGKHDAAFTVSTLEQSETRNLQLNVVSRTTALAFNFDTMADRKVIGFAAKGDKLNQVLKQMEAKAEDTWATIPKSNRADLKKTKSVPGEADATVAAKIRFDEKPKGLLQFLSFGKTFQGFDLGIENGKLYCVMRTVAGFEPAAAEARIEVPQPAIGEWHSIVASVSRYDEKMTLILNGERYEAPFVSKPGQGLVFDRIRLGYSKNKQDVLIDDLYVFDYALNATETAALSNGQVIRQKFPQNGDLANPAGVNVAWDSPLSGADTTFVIALSTDPSFKTDRQTVETTGTSAVLKGLKDDTTYYWKVGFKENGRVVAPWASFNTFKTDSSLEDPEVVIAKKEGKLKDATVKDNNYSINLGRGISATYMQGDKKKKAELFFAMVDGPSWIRCHSDGTLTTNFGAPEPGTYEFTFSVATRYGLPQEFKRTIVAR